MTIIREGVSGEDVKKLSIMFGLTPRTTCDEELVEAMKNYQRSRELEETGIFDYDSWKTLLIEERYSNNQEGKIVEQDYELFSWLLGCDKEILQAFSETCGGLCFFPNKRPRIIFDSYLFYKNLTNLGIDTSEYLKKYPEVVTDKGVNNNITGEKEWKRLETALLVNKEAAYLSTKWGMFSILGSDYRMTGETKLANFISKVSKDEFSQLCLGMEFIKNKSLIPLMIQKDFNSIIRAFCGPEFAKKGLGMTLKAHFYRNLRKK